LLSEKPDIDASEENDIKLSAMAVACKQTVSAVHSFFLAMTLYPSIQRKAQAEVDAVVGADRLPTFEDLDHLPYVDAVCKEVLRWLPVVPLSECIIPSAVTVESRLTGMAPRSDTAYIKGGRRVRGDDHSKGDTSDCESVVRSADVSREVSRPFNHVGQGNAT